MMYDVERQRSVADRVTTT